MQENQKKYSNIKIVAVLLIILILGVLSFLGYTEIKKFINKRNEIVSTLNKNTEIYNSTTEPSKELLINIKNLLDFTDLSEANILINIGKLELEIPKINNLSTSINNSTQNLDQGSFTDTKSIYTLFNEGLITKKATMDVLSGFIKYEVCLVKNSSTQYTNINDFSDQISKFSSADDKALTTDKANLVNLANKKITDNIALTNAVSDCFVDKYSNFLTGDMKEDIVKDVALYTQYSEATKSISEGLSKNNSPLLQSGTTQLLDLKDKNPVFFNSENFKKATQEPKKLLQDQATILESQEKKIKNQTQTLKSKYLLD
jgi:hypothetical protein